MVTVDERESHLLIMLSSHLLLVIRRRRQRWHVRVYGLVVAAVPPPVGGGRDDSFSRLCQRGAPDVHVAASVSLSLVAAEQAGVVRCSTSYAAGGTARACTWWWG